jgi:protease I
MYRLKEEGIDVDVAAPRAGAIVGKHDYEVEADLAFTDLSPADYDLLILPGGKAPETVRLHDAALAVVKAMVADGKAIASICHGAQVLISADVVRGLHATCYEGIRDDLKAAGADYSDEEVVVDGRLVTSRTPSDLPAFCREMMKAIRS